MYLNKQPLNQYPSYQHSFNHWLSDQLSYHLITSDFNTAGSRPIKTNCPPLTVALNSSCTSWGSFKSSSRDRATSGKPSTTPIILHLSVASSKKVSDGVRFDRGASKRGGILLSGMSRGRFYLSNILNWLDFFASISTFIEISLQLSTTLATGISTKWLSGVVNMSASLNSYIPEIQILMGSLLFVKQGQSSFVVICHCHCVGKVFE